MEIVCLVLEIASTIITQEGVYASDSIIWLMDNACLALSTAHMILFGKNAFATKDSNKMSRPGSAILNVVEISNSERVGVNALTIISE